jgi:carboxypeptidase family protein/TonB-dependent receptor-like protein
MAIRWRGQVDKKQGVFLIFSHTASRGSTRFLFALLAALTVAGIDVPGAQAQVVQGTLRDAEAGLPIAGGVVLLLDAENATRLRVRTDARGSFRLRVPGAGEYTIFAERDGYASTVTDVLTLAVEQVLDLNLSISALRSSTVPDALAEGEDLSELDPFEAAQRWAGMIAEACEGEYDPSRHAILVGVVKDSVSNVPLPMVQTIIEWEGVPDSTARVRVAFDPGTGAPRTYNQLSGFTDDDGAYLICNAPADVRLSIWAGAGTEAEGRRQALVLNRGTMKKQDLSLGLTNQTEPGDIFGVVRDILTGDPILGAEVVIEGAGVSALTNDRGVFTFEAVPWGIYVLSVKHLAYAGALQAFRVQGGLAHQIDVTMAQEAIQLEPLTVSVRPRAWFSGMSGLQHRIDLGFGYILDSNDLAERGASSIEDALRGVPGVRVIRLGARGATVRFRGSRNVISAGCEPLFYLDGVKMSLDPSLGLNEFSALDLQAIEVYRSAGEVPGEFSGLDAGCGALVMWTKRGIGR